MSERVLADAAATEAFGAALANAFAQRPGLIVHLSGPLGAGKTSLVRGALRALGVQGSVRSPTYTLMELYPEARRSVVHLDLYRLADARELHALGLADWPPDLHWWFVEWPERGAGVLPGPDLHLALEHAGDQRRVRWSGPAAGQIEATR